MKKELRLGLGLRVEEDYVLRREEVEWLEDFQLRRGSILSVQDASGRWFRVRVKELTETELRVKVFEELLKPVESGLFLILLQAVPNKERMELIIEKAVELGVDLIQPFFSFRSYQLSDFPQKKWHRWQERARKSAEQSRRGIVPKIMEPKDLAEAMEICKDVELKLVLDEREGKRGLQEVLGSWNKFRSCALAVGPEGGWEREEIEMLEQKGFVPVSMGGRILRVETAAILAVGIVEYEFSKRD